MSEQSKAVRREKRNSYIKKRKLPIRVLSLTVLISVVGLAGLLYISYSMDRIARVYNGVVKNDYANLEYMDSISQNFYRQQALVFQYMDNFDDNDKKNNLKINAKNIETALFDEVKEFGDNVIGTVYESSYHTIFSGLNGYFSNVNYIFEFGDVNDYSTAEFYMQNMLLESIEEVNDAVDLFNTLIKDDVNKTQQEMTNHLEVSRIISIVIIVLLTIFTFIGLAWSISASREIAYKDPLTGIDNMDKFQKDMDRYIKKGRITEYICVCSNIKDFTIVNQQLGSAVGDMALRNFANTVTQRLQKDERIARVGGDKFIMLIRNEHIDEFVKFVDRVSITVDYHNEAHIIQLETRCGLCRIKEGYDAGTIVDDVHLALSQTKLKAVDNIWFEENMLEQAYDRKTLLAEYQSAIKHKEFVVYYQPKVNIFNNTLCGSEALVRWWRDDKIVPPFKFIPVLEEEGRVTELDFYVFEQVCCDIRTWLDNGIKPVRVSSNFSKLHLRNPGFAEHVLEIVDRYNIDSEYLEIELTESSGYEDFDAFTEFVDKMRSRGIHISIDDFGTGYSSLSLLKKLDVDVIKIDKSFIDGIAIGDEMNESLVKNIIYMIKDLNRHVICEGVESMQQAEFLKKQNCHMVQGYLFDKPLPHDEYEERLKSPVYKDVVE
ncbi:MAG: EAL domain-containing protein [Lachnospiraceae bacterium]|nr:EAL domain-containing protein [Lachnospiraceae bacterium]MBQ9199562.1 EAL domain-containing protein [Lachnospiraceae bacterium]